MVENEYIGSLLRKHEIELWIAKRLSLGYKSKMREGSIWGTSLDGRDSIFLEYIQNLNVGKVNFLRKSQVESHEHFLQQIHVVFFVE